MRRLVAVAGLLAAGVVGAVRGAPAVSAGPAGGVAVANVGAAVPVAAAPTADGRGFWVASTDGAVTTEGDAVPYGGLSSVSLAAPVIGIASTPSGKGYWLLGSDGGVFEFGNARFYGSTGGIRLNQPALQMVPTRDGRGYWFVARDGGVFQFGDAGFYGSTGSVRLNQPVVGMAATPSGHGYWLVARDGGIFQFGDAGFHGSTGNVHLNAPIVGMARTEDGGGYWLVGRDGGVFPFGDAHFYGSAGASRLPAPVIGMVATGDGGGYWLVVGNGEVLPFGDAGHFATHSIPSVGYSLAGEVVAIDPGHNGLNGDYPTVINQLVWNGRSFETCDTTGTSTDAGYPEHAFNFDVATRLAALLRSRGASVVMTRSSDDGVGPCVNVRAAIGNQARADAVIDIHADGAPPGGRGVAVLEPVADGVNDGVIGSSAQLASDVLSSFVGATGMPDSNYDGVNGLQPRSDLAGLNLTTLPKALIECGNMRNGVDAALQTDPAWRQLAAVGIANGLSRFLIGFP